MCKYKPGDRTPSGAVVLAVFAITDAGRVFYAVVLTNGRRALLPEDELQKNSSPAWGRAELNKRSEKHGH